MSFTPWRRSKVALLLLAQARDARHVDLVDGVDVRADALLSTMRSAMMARMRVSGTGSAGRWRGRGAARGNLRCGGLLDGRVAGVTGGAENVFFGNAARGAGSGDLAEVEPCSLAMRRASGEERMRPTGAHLRWRRLWRRLCENLRRGGVGRLSAGTRGAAACAFVQARRRSAGLADDGDDGVDLDGGALREADLSENAGGGRRNLGVDLVGGDLEERLVFFDCVAEVLSHLVMVPSKIDSPIWGMMTSVGMLPLSRIGDADRVNPTLNRRGSRVQQISPSEQVAPTPRSGVVGPRTCGQVPHVCAQVLPVLNCGPRQRRLRGRAQRCGGGRPHDRRSESGGIFVAFRSAGNWSGESWVEIGRGRVGSGSGWARRAARL